MGEYADYMLNGDDCQSCGEHIGEGDGYPRNCAGCGGNDYGLPLSGNGEGKRRRKKRQRQRQNAKRREALKAFNAEGWKKLSEYHYRKEINGKPLDHWPSTGKFLYDGKIYTQNDIYITGVLNDNHAH